MCMATTADAAYALSNAARLRAIEIWSPVTADLVPVTCSIEWPGAEGYVGRSQRVSDTSMGSSIPAHVKSRAPPGTFASLWHTIAATGTLATIVCPVNSVIDVLVDLAVSDSGLAVAVTGVVALATAGVVYCRALTSPASVTLLPPVSYPTI
jgi:hypothetical protein